MRSDDVVGKFDEVQAAKAGQASRTLSGKITGVRIYMHDAVMAYMKKHELDSADKAEYAVRPGCGPKSGNGGE